jgi:hypothetical protein
MFLIWVIFFLSDLFLYRQSLPQEVREEKVLLVLDGHQSRSNLEALWLLYLFDVEVLIIPGHTSHVLQPFDLTIASPLKTYLSQIISELSLPSIEEIIDDDINVEKQRTAEETRKLFIRAFVDAFRKAATISNVRSGFEKSGMVPLQPWIPMSNGRVAPVNDKLFAGIKKVASIGSSVLTDMDQLQAIAVKERGRPMSDANCPTIYEAITRVYESTIADGIHLTALPNLYDAEGGNIRIISLH